MAGSYIAIPIPSYKREIFCIFKRQQRLLYREIHCRRIIMQIHIYLLTLSAETYKYNIHIYDSFKEISNENIFITVKNT